MENYLFLSDEWVEQARKIREEYASTPANVAHQVRMNLVITEVPFSEASIDAHLDTSSGTLQLDVGHIDPVDLAVTVDYDTAKSILVDNNPQAGMQAFMAGKIRVDGDMSKLLMLQSAPPDPRAQELAQRLKDITA